MATGARVTRNYSLPLALAIAGTFISGGLMQYIPLERGQGLVEYALILVLVAVVVIVILALLGPAIGNIFSNIIAAL